MFESQGVLAAQPPFDFTKSLAFLEMFGPSKGDFTQDATTHTRALMIDGQTLVFRLRAREDAPGIAYTLYSASPVTDAVCAVVEDRIRFFLSLDVDLTPFYALADDDPAFAPIVQRLYGYHQVLFLTPFENAVWAILSQRNLMAISSKMKAALIERYGGEHVVDGQTYRAFPEPAQIMDADHDEIRAVIGHAEKGGRLPGLARAFDSMDELWLRDAPYDQVEAWLKSIRGIGDWSARFVLLRGLGRVERIPRDEKRLQGAVAKGYGLIHATDEDVQRLGAPYGEWIGYWAHYLRAAE